MDIDLTEIVVGLTFVFCIFCFFWFLFGSDFKSNNPRKMRNKKEKKIYPFSKAVGHNKLTSYIKQRKCVWKII